DPVPPEPAVEFEPYEPSYALKPTRSWLPTMSVRKMMVVVLGLACFCALLAVLNRAVQSAREAARRSQCVCNFCGIKLALHNYQKRSGSSPPVYRADAGGRPMHSWRVLLLPFMDQQALYNQYNFAEPWDGPNNSALLKLMPSYLACPSRNDGGPA